MSPVLPQRRWSAVVAAMSASVIGLALLPQAATGAPQPQAPLPALAAPAADAAPRIEVATYNVRTARALKDKRNWLARVGDVSREILAVDPGIVLLQELGPGRADGKKAKINGAARQTTSLTSKLAQLGGSSYKLVRYTSYVKPGTSHGTQGARILYDSARFTLLSKCPETTGKKSWNPSCAFDLPIAAGDSKNKLRSAAYAKFREKNSGQAFWVVSAHLENRHGSKAQDAKMSRLRVAQVAAINARMARLNTTGLPVVFGGDINSWATDRSRYAPHRYLVSKGFRDTVSTSNRINHLYPTVNHWRTYLKKTKNGVRLDVVMVKGATALLRWENKFRQNDPTRPSDHNLVVAEFRL